MVSQKHCSEPKNGFGGENEGWCIGDALIIESGFSNIWNSKFYYDDKNNI